MSTLNIDEPNEQPELNQVASTLEIDSDNIDNSPPSPSNFDTNSISNCSIVSEELNQTNHFPKEDLKDISIAFNTHDPRCWLALAAFSSLSFVSGLAWITFASRAESFKKYYELPSTAKIDFLSAIFMITYPIFLLPGLYLGQFFLEKEQNTRQQKLKAFHLDAIASESLIISECEANKGPPKLNSIQGFGYGIKDTLILASFLHTVGCWIRFIAGKNFWVVWFGQALASLCQVFTLGMPPKLAYVWFPSQKQNIAIAIGVTSNVLGTAAGFLLAPYAVNPLNLEHSASNYLLYQSVFYTIQLVFFIFVFPKAPRCPPSNHVPCEPSASTVLTSTFELLSKPTFCSLAISYGLVVGGQYTIQTLLISLIIPYFIGHSEAEISWLGFWMLITGMIASLVGGEYLDKTHAYFKLSVILFVSTIISLVLFNLSLGYISFPLLVFACLFYGMSSSSLIPTLFQYGIDQFQTSATSNDHTSTIPGLLNSVAQIVGLILITIMSSYPDSVLSSSWVLFFVTLTGLAFLGLSWLVKKRRDQFI